MAKEIEKAPAVPVAQEEPQPVLFRSKFKKFMTSIRLANGKERIIEFANHHFEANPNRTDYPDVVKGLRAQIERNRGSQNQVMFEVTPEFVKREKELKDRMAELKRLQDEEQGRA